jgi:vacuolar-type H+-ATPase subunit E/Vma4
MAIDDILRALDEQAADDCRNVVAQARAEAEAILRDAREQAEAAREARLERARAQVEPRAGQLLNSARLQNKRDIDAVRAAAIESVFDDAAEALGLLRQDPEEYSKLLKALLDEALAGSEGDDVLAVVDEADMALMAPMVTTTTCTLTRAETPQTGVTVLACEGKVARRNTLGDRLAAVRRSSASEVAEILFG